MTITIDLPKEVEEKIKKQALKDGLEVEVYVKFACERIRKQT